MVAIPILLAPLRAVLGFKSDNHKSFIGWKRILKLGMEQCGSLGAAVMPFELVLSGDQT